MKLAFHDELLAIFQAIKHVRYFVEREFTILPTTKRLLEQFPLKQSPRQERYLDFVSQFTTDIQHIQGKPHYVITTIAKAQACDQELEDLLSSFFSSVHFGVLMSNYLRYST